jgi:hypothetical protein
VIVNDLNVARTFSRPYETDAKLVIDPNTLLTCTIAYKCLQSVSWRDSEIVKRGCSIEHRKLAHCNGLNVDEAVNPLALEETLCVSAGKGYDGHTFANDSQ